MELINLISHIAIFLLGGAVGSLITVKVTTRKTIQTNISVGKGDVVGGDKSG